MVEYVDASDELKWTTEQLMVAAKALALVGKGFLAMLRGQHADAEKFFDDALAVIEDFYRRLHGLPEPDYGDAEESVE